MTTNDNKQTIATALPKKEEPLKQESLSNSNQLNCWIAPGFNPLEKITQLKTQVNCPGGHIEQSNMYLEHQSALDWENIVRQSSYIAFQQDYPFSKAVEAIYQNLEIGKQRLDVIALGPGTGQKERILTKCLLEKLPQNSDVSFYLLDISQPLLNLSHQAANKEFKDDDRVSVRSIQGDMLEIQSYDWLISNAVHNPKQRLITMLGYTFGNLDNELSFLRNNLSVLNKGDLLLIDVVLGFAPSDNSEQIQAKDPYLNKQQVWRNPVDQFLSGPIKRYRKGSEELNFKYCLDNQSSVVPGSYCVEMRVTGKLDNGTHQDLSIFRFKRYDPDKLVNAVINTGIWDYVTGWKFGVGHEILLYLFVKK